jgi:hypothetical protein
MTRNLTSQQKMGTVTKEQVLQMRSKLEKSDAHPEQLEDILKQLLTAVSLGSFLHGLKNHRT